MYRQLGAQTNTRDHLHSTDALYSPTLKAVSKSILYRNFYNENVQRSMESQYSGGVVCLLL